MRKIIFLLLIFVSSQMSNADELLDKNFFQTLQPDKLENLIQSGRLDITQKNQIGFTIMYPCAIINNNPEVIKTLIKYGANVNNTGAENITPLHAAAQYNPNPEITEVLIKSGAKVNAQSTRGVTPLCLQLSHHQMLQ